MKHMHKLWVAARRAASVRMLGLLALAVSPAAPAQAQTCTPFTDVPASDPFCSNIQWMYNRGVTLGCAANLYCPTNFVRRDQMAAFMNRLADSLFGQGAPIVVRQSAGAWRTASSSAPTAFDILGPDAFLGATGIAPPATGNNVAYSLPLTGPAQLGGNSYRLSQVEYCLRTVNASVKVDSASIFSDNFNGSLPLTLEVIDNTDRTAVGCYSVSTTNGTARDYALVLSIAQVSGTTGGLIISGVRSTWIPTQAPPLDTGAAPAPAPGDQIMLTPPDDLLRYFSGTR